MKTITDDLRITDIKHLDTPEQLQTDLPITKTAQETVFQSRQAIHKILHQQDDKLLVIVGPCSVHDTHAAKEYAIKLNALRIQLKDDLEIVMRVYFEKPRTTVGWKGLINDPDLNSSFNINKGLHLARELLLHINGMNLPTATEYLDLISPQYIADLVSWGAIGARTTESQVHRELASGVSCPIGFKNATNGCMKVAIDAIQSASQPHHFLSVNKAGRSSIFSTKGNEDCHIILRGGNERPNYDAASVKIAQQEMKKANMLPRLMVDFSHANSEGVCKNQITIGDNIATQISKGNASIKGVMIESHLVEGRQNLQADTPLTYGQSITDACINWEDTEVLLTQLAKGVQKRRELKSQSYTAHD